LRNIGGKRSLLSHRAGESPNSLKVRRKTFAKTKERYVTVMIATRGHRKLVSKKAKTLASTTE